MKQNKTLAKMKKKPTPTDVTWAELCTLLESKGYHQVGGAGSRVKFVHPGGNVISLHRPHPQPHMKQYAVRLVLDYLGE